jgi:hypothetical protein
MAERAPPPRSTWRDPIMDRPAFGGGATCESCPSIDLRAWHRQGRLDAGNFHGHGHAARKRRCRGSTIRSKKSACALQDRATADELSMRHLGAVRRMGNNRIWRRRRRRRVEWRIYEGVFLGRFNKCQRAPSHQCQIVPAVGHLDALIQTVCARRAKVAQASSSAAPSVCK